MQLTNEEIKEMNKLLESVKASNNSSITVLCCKEHEEYFKEHLKGYKIVVLPKSNGFEVDKNTIWIIPDKGDAYDYRRH